MKVDKAISFLAAIGSILSGIGEMLKQYNNFQGQNKIAPKNE